MSKRKAISVSLAKIDYNHGEPHLYIIADCPRDYKLVHMGVTVWAMENSEWKDQYYTLDSLVVDKEDIVLNLPLSVLEGAHSPAIYHVHLQAVRNDGEREIHDELLLSDVHGVYRSMLDNILQSTECSGISNDVIKEYLILHAHQQALFNKDIYVAKDMFKLLHKLPCGNKYVNNTNCGCYDRH